MDNPPVISPSVETIENSLSALSLPKLSGISRLPSENSDEPSYGCVTSPTAYEINAEQQAIIRKALDQQTQLLYEQYAKEQHPKDPQKQKELVLDMQEQFFTRYLLENHQNQLSHQREQRQQLTALQQKNTGGDESSVIKAEPVAWPLIPATIWTRKEIADFKQEILRTQRDCCIKIGSLATATIRVPTHPDGTAIFWEFATDHYDLGFGLHFEWDLQPPSTVSINISESSDEEQDDDDESADGARSADARTHTDIERGHRTTGSQFPTDELIPIYRRDCHTEVYCGSHHYPGVGVYVFKFDNSFSLWRSKWLYYRIYYTQ